MQTKNEYEPKPGAEKDPKITPTDAFGEEPGSGGEERPPDVVVEN